MVSKEDAFKSIQEGRMVLFIGAGATADNSGVDTQFIAEKLQEKFLGMKIENLNLQDTVERIFYSGKSKYEVHFEIKKILDEIPISLEFHPI